MKRYKGIVILSLVLIVLLGVYYYTLNRPNVEEETEQKDTISIFKTDKENISEIKITTEADTFSFYSQLIEVKETEDGEKQEKKEWRTAREGDINLQQSKIDSLAYDLATINAEQMVEEDVEDLSIYGLLEPSGILEVILDDGGSETFHVGDKTPTGTGYYFRKYDENIIYTIYSHKGESFTSTLNDYREKQLVNLNAEDIISIEIEAQGQEKLFIQQKKDDTSDDEGYGYLSIWDVIRPYKRNGDNEKIHDLILDNLTQITIKDFINDMPKDLNEYGLNPAKYTIKVVDKENNIFSLLLGDNKDSNSIYIKLEDGKSVYTIESNTVQFKDIDPFTLIERFVYLINIDTVDKFIVKHEGKESIFEIIQEKNEDDGDEDQSFIYKANGKDIEESLFKKFYQQVIGLTVDQVYSIPVEGNAEVSYTFYHNDGSDDVTVNFISVDDRNYAVVKNGLCEFLIRKKHVKEMLKVMEMLR